MTTKLALREEQTHTIELVQENLRTINSLLVTAPTGFGKTLILSEIGGRIASRNLQVAVLVHRQELVEQSEATIINQTGITPGVVWQNRREWDAPIVILAQDTLSAIRTIPIQNLYLLMVDEAHHAVAPGWLNNINRLHPRFLLGFSATPFRHDREPLSPIPFAKVIRPVTPQQLIDRNLLCPAIIESPVVHDANGQPQPINQAANIEHIYTQAVRYAIADNRTKIILYVSQTQEYTPVQVTYRTTEALRRAGITADAITVDLNSTQRKAAISRFRNTQGASVLVNYMTLTEGTDIPNVDCVILGRNTASESTIIQMIGRGLRPYPQKENCLVIAFINRSDMNDIIHYWRLDSPREEGGNAGKERKPNIPQSSLMELATNFPRQLSTLGNTWVQYPWFKPFPERPVLALSIWAGKNTPPRYITIEPTKNSLWKVTTITLQSSGPAPLLRQQTTAPDQSAAAAIVRSQLGERAPTIQRDAAWRLKPASDPQKQAWTSLHRDTTLPPDLTAGQASDAIAQRRFQLRVDPSVL